MVLDHSWGNSQRCSCHLQKSFGRCSNSCRAYGTIFFYVFRKKGSPSRDLESSSSLSPSPSYCLCAPPSKYVLACLHYAKCLITLRELRIRGGFPLAMFPGTAASADLTEALHLGGW